MAPGRAVRKAAAEKPPRAIRKRIKKGSADSLTGSAWRAWLLHVKERTGPTWLYIVLSMCHLFCARVSQVLQLKLEHINLEARTVVITGMKGQPTCTKPLSEAAMTLLNTWQLAGGEAVQRTRRWGARGVTCFRDHWPWPSNSGDFMFPATRKDSKVGHKTKARTGLFRLKVAGQACCQVFRNVMPASDLRGISEITRE